MIEKNYRKKKRNFLSKYYVDETYVKVNGKWMYLYRAIDKNNETIDFFSSNRSKKAAKRFIQRMFKNYGIPEEITLDKNQVI